MDMMAELEKICKAAEKSADANPGSPEAATVFRLAWRFRDTVKNDLQYPTVSRFDDLRKGD